MDDTGSTTERHRPPVGATMRAGRARDTAGGDAWSWVDAAPFRAHVRRLMLDDALPWRLVAGLAGVPDGVVRTLVLGRRGRLRPRLPHRDAYALLALDRTRVAAARCTVVPGAPTRRAGGTLLSLGHGVPEVAEMLDLTARRTRAILTGAAATVLVEQRALAACRAHGIDLGARDDDATALLRCAASAPSAA